MADDAPVPIEEMSTCPEIFVDGFQGAITSNGVVKFNFFQQFNDVNTGEVRRKAAVRLTMTIADFVSMFAGFGSILSDFERDGLIIKTVSEDGEQ